MRPHSARRSAIEGIARGSSEAIVERGSTAPVVHRPVRRERRPRSSPAEPTSGRLGAVTPVPGGGTVRHRRPGRRVGDPDRRPPSPSWQRTARPRCSWMCRRTDVVAADVRLAERPLRRGAHRAGRRDATRTTPTSSRCRERVESRIVEIADRRRGGGALGLRRLVVPGAAPMTGAAITQEHFVRADLRPATRGDLSGLPVEVAPRLLGGVLTTVVDGETVAVRLTEVEAYHGAGTGEIADPGSHARMGRTQRNATMWGEPGSPVRVPQPRHPLVCERRVRPGGCRRRDPAARRRSAARTGCRRPAPAGTPRSGPIRSRPGPRSGPFRRCDRASGIRCTTASTRSPDAARRSGRPARTARDPARWGRDRPAGRGGRCRGDGCLPLALLDRRRSDGVRLPLGPRRSRRRDPALFLTHGSGRVHRRLVTAVKAVRSARTWRS